MEHVGSKKLHLMSSFAYLPAGDVGESCHHHGGDSVDATLHYLEGRTRIIISSSHYYCGAGSLMQKTLF